MSGLVFNPYLTNCRRTFAFNAEGHQEVFSAVRHHFIQDGSPLFNVFIRKTENRLIV